MIKKEQREEKANNKRKFTYLIIILFIIMIFIAFIMALNNAGLINFDRLNSLKPKQAELKYTETNDKVKEGIYITDVSEVVEEVMPSIVSITSKTLVNSGMFGPFYSGERYAEGAGSGIIVSKTDSELLILTNNHVVEGAEELSVQFVNEKNVDATIKGTSSRKDVAVISVKLSSLDNETIDAIKIATLGDSTKLKVGNEDGFMEASRIKNDFFNANNSAHLPEDVFEKVKNESQGLLRNIFNEEMFDEALKYCFSELEKLFEEYKKTEDFKILYKEYFLTTYIHCKMRNIGLINKF